MRSVLSAFALCGTFLLAACGQQCPVTEKPSASVALTVTDARSSSPIVKSADGHFWTTATINGTEVRTLVDTGATLVALTVDDARRLGMNVDSSDLRQEVTTAEGTTQAAIFSVNSISVNGVQVRDVKVLVVPSLKTSLLGMSYLGRLSGFEATQSTLTLRP